MTNYIKDNPLKFLRHYYYWYCEMAMKKFRDYETRFYKSAKDTISCLNMALDNYKKAIKVKKQYDAIREIYKTWKNWVY